MPMADLAYPCSRVVERLAEMRRRCIPKGANKMRAFQIQDARMRRLSPFQDEMIVIQPAGSHGQDREWYGFNDPAAGFWIQRNCQSVPFNLHETRHPAGRICIAEAERVGV